MRTLLVAMVLIAFCSTNSNAAPAKWEQETQVDDFDDSKTFISSITASGQGAIIVRYHESSHSDYEIYWVVPDAPRTCGDTGSWLEHSGWRNIQVRIDGGKIMSFTGGASTDKKAAFFKNGTEDNVATLVQSLIGAKKVVIRTKDKCYKEGQSWLFSKFEEIVGQNYLKGIKFQP